jgi:hypothetical protein
MGTSAVERRGLRKWQGHVSDSRHSFGPTFGPAWRLVHPQRCRPPRCASTTLFAQHALDLFTILSTTDGATADDAAAAVGIARRPAEMWLTACASLGLLDKRDGRYHNSPLAQKYLVQGGRTTLAASSSLTTSGPSYRRDRRLPRPQAGAGSWRRLLSGRQRAVPGGSRPLRYCVRPAHVARFAAEYEQWLTAAGFRGIRRVPVDVPGANGLLIAVKPSGHRLTARTLCAPPEPSVWKIMPRGQRCRRPPSRPASSQSIAPE